MSLARRFVLEEKIGSGSFGEVFKAHDMANGRRVAVKREATTTGRSPQLIYEMQIIKSLDGAVGFCRFFSFWPTDGFNCVAMDCLGLDLNSIFDRCSRRFTLKTVLMIADQAISRLQFFHEKNVIHRDIKPENFVMGRGPRDNIVHMIDFGLSRSYRDAMVHVHIPERDGRGFLGTVRYASINNHRGIEPSRRDDMEGVAYMLIYFLRARLPWQGVKGGTRQQKLAKVQDIKMMLSTESLCAGIHTVFGRFLDDVRRLEFAERPRYEEYRMMFRTALIEEGFAYDYQWHWLEKGVMADEAPVFDPPEEVVRLDDQERFTAHTSLPRRSRHEHSHRRPLIMSPSCQGVNVRPRGSKDRRGVPVWMRRSLI